MKFRKTRGIRRSSGLFAMSGNRRFTLNTNQSRRIMQMKKALALILALLFVLSLAGCKKKTGGNETGNQGEFVYGLATEIDNFDPFVATTADAKSIYFNIYEGLTRVSPDGTFVPAVASEVTVSDDAKVYTFKLRDNVYFHNGNRVTMEDVLYSVKHAMDSALTGYSNIASFRTEDSKTLVITLTNGSTDFLANASAPIIPADSDNNGEHALKPIGTGPYAFSEYAVQDHVTLVKNEQYWGEPASLDKITIRFIASSSELLVNYQAGAIDGFTANAGITEQVDKNTSVINVGNSNAVQMLALNNSAAPFDKGFNLDGAGHTISGLKSSGVAYASFAGVMYGSLTDVTFSGATISATSKAGVVAGFLGTTQADYSRVATCTNVTVAGSTVTSTAAAGGFAGHVRGKGAVTGCKVVNTTVNGTSHLGGFAGIADISGIDKYEIPAIFTACEVDGVTLNQNLATNSSAIYTGGFIGESYQAHTFIDCKVKGTSITATKAVVSNIGGFAGYTGYAGANFVRCEVDDATTITAKGGYTGGFVGYATTSDAYTTCSTAATVSAEASSVGGFAGWACGSATFNDCVATGNVSGQRFTAGFAGVAENVAFINCRYSGGTVTANTTHSNSRVGGFVGSCIGGVSLNGCHVSDATVSASGAGRVGGFVGQLGNSSAGGNNVTTTQCYVENTSVTGALNTGGFSGVQYETTTSCYVSGGSVTAKGNDCGGFSGFIQNGDIRHCYTTAAVSGGSYSPVGGFVGIAYATNVSYCYAAGSVSGSGANVASFVGQCAKQGDVVATFSKCIGWDATLPFCASNTVEASITDVYSGNEGTVSAHAVDQTWPTTVWNLGGDLPLLLGVPARIPAIFVGDSITWQWARSEASYSKEKYPLLIPFDSAYMKDDGTNVTVYFHPGFFSGNGYIDKGISGQNTFQMFERFEKDVIALNPQVVVIMGGTNDLAQGVSKDEIVSNIMNMATMAEGAGIQVVLCTVTPNNDYYSRLNPHEKGTHIIALNEMLHNEAMARNYAWCDYWTSLVADDGLSLKEEYRLYDNLHPGPVAYTVMEGIIKPIIDGLL